MGFSLEKEKKLVKRWFDQVKRNEVNDEVLCIDEIIDRDALNSLKHQYGSFFSIYDSKKNYLNINQNFIYPRNTTNDISVGNIEQLLRKKTFLYISKISTSLGSNNTKSIEDDFNIYVPKEERYLYYLEKTNPIELLHNNIDMKNYLKDRIHKLHSIFGRGTVELLLKGINYEFEKYLKQYECDIDILKENNLLTSRLAVLIYRVSTLNLKATTTESGRFFREKLGTKSRVFNDRHIGGEYFIGSLIAQKFKGYDLNHNEVETGIRREFAKNLMGFEEYNFDVNQISNMTKLSIDEVEYIKINN